jgi:gluconolactonase
VDIEGNVYITANGVDIYSSSGELLENIKVPAKPTNVGFGGKDGKTLFITTIPAIYMIRMNVKGER